MMPRSNVVSKTRIEHLLMSTSRNLATSRKANYVGRSEVPLFYVFWKCGSSMSTASIASDRSTSSEYIHTIFVCIVAESD